MKDIVEIQSPEVSATSLAGQDPRTITEEEWSAADIPYPAGSAAIRSKCLDCGFSHGVVRKCTVTSCSLWPRRLGCVP